MNSLFIDNNKCNLCGECINNCPFNALKLDNGGVVVQDGCTLCGLCADNCSNNAISIFKTKVSSVNKDEWQGILVYVEHNCGKIHPITYELIGKALELSKSTSYKVYCVFIGYNIKESAKALSEYEVEEVFVYDDPAFEFFREDIYANAFEKCIDKLRPSVVLVGGTLVGKSLAPRLASRFKTGLTADCTELQMKDNTDLVQIRPAFGGNIMAQIITTNNRPQFATVRYKVMAAAEKKVNNNTKITFCSINKDKLKSQIDILKVYPTVTKDDITDAKVLVVAGRGFKSKEDLWMVEQLAKVLGGKTASSRALVEKGFMPYEKQIGLSGKTVKPQVIITCGVSGSVQFMAGMRASDNIYAINSDKDAPIFSIAHYPICGDIYEIVPKLIAKLNDKKVDV